MSMVAMATAGEDGAVDSPVLGPRQSLSESETSLLSNHAGVGSSPVSPHLLQQQQATDVIKKRPGWVIAEIQYSFIFVY